MDNFGNVCHVQKVYCENFALEGGLLPVTYLREKLRTSPLIAISQQSEILFLIPPNIFDKMLRNIILVFCIPMILLISCIVGVEKMAHIMESSPFTHNATGKIKSTTIYFYPNNDTSGKYEVATYTVYDKVGRAIIVNDTLAATDNIIARHLEYSSDKISGWNAMNKTGDVSNKAIVNWESENQYSTTVVNNRNITVYQNTVDLNPDYSLKAICETFFDSSEVIYSACRAYKYDETGKVSNCTYTKGLYEGVTSIFTVNDIDNHGNPILLTESGGNGTINRNIRILYDYYK